MSNPYTNNKIGKIGVVSATERDPITSDKFTFWMAAEKKSINVSDIIAVPEEDDSTTFGQVVGLERYTDSVSHISNFISSNFGKPEHVPPTQRIKMVLVRSAVILNTKNKKSPLMTGLPVYYASPDGVEKAFGFKDYETPISAGIFVNGDGEKTIVKLDSKFILGKEGAHLTVSGISGLATKTSYVMFLIQSIMQKISGVSTVIFNVKSDDLLYVDKENTDTKFDDNEIKKYNLMDIDANPFPKENAKYFLPRNRDGSYNSSRFIQEEDDNISMYAYDLEDSRGRIIYLFEREDINEPLEALISTIEEKLIEWRGQAEAKTFDGLLSKIQVRTPAPGRSSTTWEDHHSGTVLKFKSRLRHFVHRGTTGVFVAGEKEEEEKSLRRELRKMKSGDIFVIDIERLNPREQSFVFGDVVTTLSNLLSSGYEEEMERKFDVDKVIVYVDELNKFAPSGTSRSPLKRHLIDIAARGRSIGFCLFGAEQFASGVEDEIIGNCSTSVLGRTNPVEIGYKAYRFLSTELQSLVLKLEQGKLLLNHSRYFRPIIISFPVPSYLQGKE